MPVAPAGGNGALLEVASGTASTGSGATVSLTFLLGSPVPLTSVTDPIAQACVSSVAQDGGGALALPIEVTTSAPVGGAVVLVLLGIKAWRSASRAHEREPSLTGQAGRAKAFGNGLLVQLANPKTATLLIAFYPQFVPSGRPLLATTAELALLQVTIESVLYLTVAIAVSRVGDWFRRPVIRRRLEAVSGTVLIALGIRVAVLYR